MNSNDNVDSAKQNGLGDKRLSLTHKIQFRSPESGMHNAYIYI